MAIPDFQSIMRPLLEFVSDGQTRTLQESITFLGDEFRLTEDEKSMLLPSGTQTVFHNRVSWARSYLKAAGLLENPQRGQMKITPSGIATLKSHQGPIGSRFLERFESFRNFKTKPSEVPNHTLIAPNKSADDEMSPEERLEEAFEQMKTSLNAEMLAKLKACSPAFFERIVVELLIRMGYGGMTGHGKVTRQSGDGGIDGIINQDKLGLDLVCIQAKRWENTVGRPVVQGFVGSMDYVRARKGVILTTSSFSRDAEDYVQRIEGKKVVLIDGEELAKLMIDHNLGVTVKRAFELKDVSNDFFEEE